MNSVLLKIYLLCKGARTSENIDKGRKGGAGPCGGRYIILPDGTCVDLPLQGKFTEKSPFSLVQQDGKWFIHRNDEICVDVRFVQTPAFYEKTTSDGTLMRKVAVLHGMDCLASTVYSRCVHWSSGMQCRFCGIELSQGQPLLLKKPQQLAEVAEEAFKEGAAKHATLTIGTPPEQDKGASLLAAAASEIRERVNLPIHVQLEPPRNRKSLQLLSYSGVDTVGIHIESFDDYVRTEVCPVKTQAEEYFKAWRESVELFGEGQVSSFIIAGLGESDESILLGAENLARIGVIPYVLPLRPMEGTVFERVSPPTPNRMVKLYRKVAETLHSYGLDPMKNKAGCVRCGACAALQEVYLRGI